jgi:pimeloyl-ACP methyl ester carboxylesterase
MHAIRVPTLLVWGENDPLVPLQYGQAMQHEIEGSRLVVIPRAATWRCGTRPKSSTAS